MIILNDKLHTMPETPIQRPKKDKNNLILVKRKNTRSKHKYLSNKKPKKLTKFARKNMIMLYLKNQNPNSF
ncbi:hypothetical protein MNU24_06365 [Spiroplasma poulsonii]|nr:hypothetical protein [Spiroplasma poulsonii]UNF61535.1 hypothetical protein MNU24_06365 [Spiroplasma poulsonii]